MSDRLDPISQELAVYTVPQSWEPARGYTESDLRELRASAMQKVMESPVGQLLFERGGPDVVDRLLTIFSTRYENKFPSSTPFVEILEQCATDLLTDLPVPGAPKVMPKPVSVQVASAEDKEKERQKLEADSKHEGKVRQFAYLVKKQLNRDGYRSLKPHAGIVTVVAETGDTYDYPSSIFDNLWADAVKLGLLTTGGLQ